MGVGEVDMWLLACVPRVMHASMPRATIVRIALYIRTLFKQTPILMILVSMDSYWDFLLNDSKQDIFWKDMLNKFGINDTEQNEELWINSYRVR